MIILEVQQFPSDVSRFVSQEEEGDFWQKEGNVWWIKDK